MLLTSFKLIAHCAVLLVSQKRISDEKSDVLQTKSLFSALVHSKKYFETFIDIRQCKLHCNSFFGG